MSRLLNAHSSAGGRGGAQVQARRIQPGLRLGLPAAHGHETSGGPGAASSHGALGLPFLLGSQDTACSVLQGAGGRAAAQRRHGCAFFWRRIGAGRSGAGPPCQVSCLPPSPQTARLRPPCPTQPHPARGPGGGPLEHHVWPTAMAASSLWRPTCSSGAWSRTASPSCVPLGRRPRAAPCSLTRWR